MNKYRVEFGPDGPAEGAVFKVEIVSGDGKVVSTLFTTREQLIVAKRVREAIDAHRPPDPADVKALEGFMLVENMKLT